MGVNYYYLFPRFIADCHMCGRGTPAKIVHVSRDIGNACAVCGAFRKGRPYISREDFRELKSAHVFEMVEVKEGDQ